MRDELMNRPSERSCALWKQCFETLIRAVIGASLMLTARHALAEPARARVPARASDSLEEIVVSGDRMDVMQSKPVDSVFGFDKTVLETPRSLTAITNDLLNKTIITGINDLVALTPGSFTQSFFGVAGSLDVRGTAGENYFRGVRRIDNPGNYPTPIGASDSIDIVRGPASPIFGPSKVGGYLNFNPKFKKAVDGDDSVPTGGPPYFPCLPQPGAPQPIANQYGLISQAAAGAADLGTSCNFLFNPSTLTPAQIQAALQSNPNLALANSGTAHINGNQVLVAPNDTLGDNVTDLYFDLYADLDNGLKIVNKSFFEYLDNINENAYGFSQYARTWAVEDQLNMTMKLPVTDCLSTNLDFGPSVRHHKFDFGDDFNC